MSVRHGPAIFSFISVSCASVFNVLFFPIFLLQLRVVKYLMSHGVNSSQISVITPYSAQRAKISRELQTSLSSCDSEVLSVFASQGVYYSFATSFIFTPK